jgi:glycosyltransferase involved in cell wall biosynthesis
VTKEPPFFSIISVCYDDSWALMKTARSVFEQSCGDFEYIVVDGGSLDGTRDLIDFWKGHGLISQAVSEKDAGVYSAMNKGIDMARGRYILFLNASDIFSNEDVLERARELIEARSLDGLLGWGQLNDQIWASWVADEAFKIASLGFCHQALFVRRELLLQEKFDERTFKTDSDTLQLGRLFARGAQISILPEVLAVRGGEPGISADLAQTHTSICNTLIENYPSLDATSAEQIVAFRRQCVDHEVFLSLMRDAEPRLARHLAYMALDTIFQKASAILEEDIVQRIILQAVDIILAYQDPEKAQQDVERLTFAQKRRAKFLAEQGAARADLDRAVSVFEGEETARIQKLRSSVNIGGRDSDLVVSLTSFPARIKTVHFAIRSLYEQTCRPAEVHLWLGRDEVPAANWLPTRLQELQTLGLKVHFADRTFHQYDKFMHNAKLNADRPFVIVDDDVIYPSNALEMLVNAHKDYPGAVIGNRCHEMAVDDAGNIAPYKMWRREVNSPEPHLRLLPTGAGGVLYPPGFLSDPMVTSHANVLKHAPYADDIWLKACALAWGIPTFATALSQGADWYHRYTPTMLAGTLMSTNVDRGLNDTQIRRCQDWVESMNPNWRAEFVQKRLIL